jgi:serine/threonine protein kinase
MLKGMSTTTEFMSTLRWMSPELILGEVGPNVKSDVWAYGMTVLASSVFYYEDV